MEWTRGDRAYYVLPTNPRNGRPRPLYLIVEVINVTEKRVVVRNVNVKPRNHRVLKVSKLVKDAPEGAWIL